MKKSFGRSNYGLKVLHLVVASDKVDIVFAYLDELKIILFPHIHRTGSSSLQVGGIIFYNYHLFSEQVSSTIALFGVELNFTSYPTIINHSSLCIYLLTNTGFLSRIQKHCLRAVFIFMFFESVAQLDRACAF